MASRKFVFLAPVMASKVKPGTILFLPMKYSIPKGAYLDSTLNDGAFNHPVIVVSCPTSAEMKHDSKVEIAIMTSFSSTSIKSHFASKGIIKRTGSLAASATGHLRVVTASKPYATDTLKLRNGKGMRKDFSYIKVMQTFEVELRALALYGWKHDVDSYRLTGQAMRKVVEAVEKYKTKKMKQEAGANKRKEILKSKNVDRHCKVVKLGSDRR